MKTSKKRVIRPKPRPAAARRRAASADILAGSARPPKSPGRWKGHYRNLAGLRTYFLEQKGLLSEDANEQHPAFSLHPADAATDNFDRDLALGMLSSDQNALIEIDAAIRRIEGGSYGICEFTGRRIEAKRLMAIPWTRYSLEAEKELEAKGAVNRARIGRATPLSDVTASDEEAAESE